METLDRGGLVEFNWASIVALCETGMAGHNHLGPGVFCTHQSYDRKRKFREKTAKHG